jgi:hypothetical protein
VRNSKFITFAPYKASVVFGAPEHFPNVITRMNSFILFEVINFGKNEIFPGIFPDRQNDVHCLSDLIAVRVRMTLFCEYNILCNLLTERNAYKQTLQYEAEPVDNGE